METRDFMMIFFVILLFVTFIVILIMWYSIGCCTYTTDSNTTEDTTTSERAASVRSRIADSNLPEIALTRRVKTPKVRNPLDRLDQLNRDIGEFELPIFRRDRVHDTDEPIEINHKRSTSYKRSILDDLDDSNCGTDTTREIGVGHLINQRNEIRDHKTITECGCDDQSDHKKHKPDLVDRVHSPSPSSPLKPSTPISEIRTHTDYNLGNETIISDIKDDIDKFGTDLISKLSETIKGTFDNLSTQVESVESASSSIEQTSSSTQDNSIQQTITQPATPKAVPKRAISYSNLDNVISDINSQLDAIMNGK